MAQKYVFAKKGTQVKKFLETTWKLLKDKNGWELVDTSTIGKKAESKETVEVVGPKKPMPPTGQAVKNTAPEKEEVVVENNIEGAALATETVENNVAEVVESNTTDVTEETVEVVEDQNAAANDATANDQSNTADHTEFIDFVKANLTKGQIKDHFDKPEVNVSYKNDMNLTELSDLLGQSVNYSIDEVKTIFGIEVATQNDL